MLDILSLIPKKKRSTSTGWVVFDGICCQHRGHKPDKRSRAGISYTDNSNWTYHCFNCQFKCSFTLGKHFSLSLKQLLKWCGVDYMEIERLSFKSFSYGSVLDLYSNKKNVSTTINFASRELPENSRLVTEDDGEIYDYIKARNVNLDSYEFYTVDDETRKRVIIPYYYQSSIVGYTSRFLDNRHPKYVSEQQKGFVFNLDKQKSDWSACILVEGQFDAMSIDGCAYMHSTISDEQVRLLRTLHKRIIVVPDRDKSGLSVCDRALELGFSVSLPNWSEDIKDVNDAVIKYGKLPTLISILEAASSSKITVEMKRKKINVK